jgi:hypothetical protein
MIEKLSSRKFIIAVLSLLSVSVLCWFGKIDAGVFATVAVATVGAYLAANVAQKQVEA